MQARACIIKILWNIVKGCKIKFPFLHQNIEFHSILVTSGTQRMSYRWCIDEGRDIDRLCLFGTVLIWCEGVDTVDDEDSEDVQDVRVTNPALRPASWGEISFSRTRSTTLFDKIIFILTLNLFWYLILPEFLVMWWLILELS